MTDIMADFAYLLGKPEARAKLKAKPEHFIVKEDLGYSFTGSGEHLMVKVRKVGENTTFVANELARYCGVKSKDIGWAGLKDRHAVTEQWLSIHLPKTDSIDFASFEASYPTIKILECDRHNKKLRPGDLKGNLFEITLTEVSDLNGLEARLVQLTNSGVPNYFGSQRFGRDGNNLTEARRWGRENVRTRNQNKRSMYLSTARSWIFNTIVSNRIKMGMFDSLLLGDLVHLTSEQDNISVEQASIPSLTEALEASGVNITAALAGDNALPTSDKALDLEQAVLDSEPELMALIRGNRMRHERRDIRLKPQALTYKIGEGEVTLSFGLPSGCFATSIIRELVQEIPVERQYS